MRKARIAVVAASIALAAAPALASTIVAGPFQHRGECHKWRPWNDGSSAREDWRPFGHQILLCRQIEGQWWVIQV